MTTLHTPLSRRQLLTATITGAAAFAITGRAQEKTWQAGPVRHLLPGVSHDRLLLKASFVRPMTAPPILRAGRRKAIGVRLDTAGEFYSFDLAGLEPEHTYQLVLEDASGRSLCDPWPISTFPSPQATPKRFRLFVYTCAGGHPATINPDTKGPYWVSIANRRKMLLTGLSYKPDAMIAIGDHVYWDLRSPVGSVMLGNAPEAQKLVGQFTRDMPVLGTDNERKLKLVVTPQICDLYGTDFRSTPVFFVQDDHDYFENDEATEQMVTFPPDDFMLRLARATQRLYYPEFLPDASRPLGLPQRRRGSRGRSVGVVWNAALRQAAGDPDVRLPPLHVARRAGRRISPRDGGGVGDADEWPRRRRGTSSICRRRRLVGAPGNGASGIRIFSSPTERWVSPSRSISGSRAGTCSTTVCCRPHRPCRASHCS